MAKCEYFGEVRSFTKVQGQLVLPGRIRRPPRVAVIIFAADIVVGTDDDEFLE